MRIAVTTPTGHIGRAVADFLLEFGGDVRVDLLCRRPEKLRGCVDRGATVCVGSLDDPNYLIKSTRNVDALFWVTPPSYGSDNLRDFQNRLGSAAAIAIRTNRIPRVVNLSSIGAQHASGVGPINGLHDVEHLLENETSNITHLRPGFFFENLLMQLEGIKTSGRFSLPVSGSRRYPMIATRDIARVACERLLDPIWTGNCNRELHGPADLCFDEIATILSDVLVHRIDYVKCSRKEARQMMHDHALSDNAIELMLEMYEAVESGRLRPTQPRSADTTTPTTLAEFAHDVIVPMIAAPVAH